MVIFVEFCYLFYASLICSSYARRLLDLLLTYIRWGTTTLNSGAIRNRDDSKRQIQQFPDTTQTTLPELSRKLKQQNVDSLAILVMRKGGVGRSAIVSQLVGERVVLSALFKMQKAHTYLLNVLVPEICDPATLDAKDPAAERESLVLNHVDKMGCER